MTRNRLTVQSWGRRSLAHRPGVEPLDVRILPSVVGSPVDPRQNRAIGLTPAVAVRVGAATAAVAQGVVPLSGVPALNSLPGAVAALYLDFDGFFESAWGSYRNISTPAFDQDGDASSFSLGELDTIRRIWSSVAEDFAPFRINVTTVQPLTFANRVAERVAIGGDGAWTGDLYGGISYIDSFTNSIPNTAYVFPRNLGNGDAKYTAEAISHEAGHAFGLQHQSRYDAYGNKIDEYSTGPGDGLAPIMGVSYYATRGLWWYGTSSVSAQAIQDDMALLARSANGFGYRADDHGDTATSATPLVVSGLQLNGAGIITTTADRDVFSFTTNAGTVNVAVDVPAGINNLDARLELRDASGTTLIASAAPSDRFGASISVPVAAGSYRLVVASQGGYGDVGQYTVRGTVATSTNEIAAPTNLAATAVSPTQVNLSWTDNATNESGNLIERTTYGGTDWFVIAVTPAGATSYSDPTAEPGTAYQYRVLAFNDVTESSFSNVASVTTVPLAPAGLTATAVSPSQINLSWGDVAGETGYRVERSTDGSTWTLAGTTGANVTTFQDTGRTASTTYQYRIQATNGGGSSSYSNVASARTTVDSSLPAAPPYINVSDPGQLYYRRARLIWIDASNNEDGFQLERSTDGGKSWTRIASVGRDLTRYTDDLTFYYPDGNYSYRVRAFNSSGFSDYSPPNSNLIRIHYPWSYSSWSYSSAPGVRGTGVESSSAGFSGASLAPPIPSNSLPAVQVSTAGVSTTPPSTNSSPSLADSPHARFVDQVIDEWDPLAGPGARRRSLVIMA